MNPEAEARVLEDRLDAYRPWEAMESCSRAYHDEYEFKGPPKAQGHGHRELFRDWVGVGMEELLRRETAAIETKQTRWWDARQKTRLLLLC